MSIIVSKGGGNAQRLSRSAINEEEYLQNYVHNNPEVLPLDELKDNLRLLILAREFNTASGPIDALGIDLDGEIYIIEAKLNKNADRRRIIAQALDYGAALWTNSAALMQRLKGTDWRKRVAEFIGGDEAVTAKYLETVEQNAVAGRFWFVVLMDQLDERLRALISFVNANSRFKILGVEISLYRHGEMEILIPKLFGAEIATEAATELKTSAASKREAASRESFLAGSEKLGPESGLKLRRLLDWASENGRVAFHSTSFGLIVEAISPKPIFWAYHTDGKIELNIKGLVDAGQRLFVDQLAHMLSEKGFIAHENVAEMKYPRIAITQWGPQREEFLQSLKTLLQSDTRPRADAG